MRGTVPESWEVNSAAWLGDFATNKALEDQRQVEKVQQEGPRIADNSSKQGKSGRGGGMSQLQSQGVGVSTGGSKGEAFVQHHPTAVVCTSAHGGRMGGRPTEALCNHPPPFCRNEWGPWASTRQGTLRGQH